MKKLNFVLAVALGLVTLHAADVDVSKEEHESIAISSEKQVGRAKLTLAEAKKIALADNPSLATAKARIESAVQAVGQAKAAYYPSLDLSAGYTRLRDQTTTRPDRDFDNQDRYAVDASLTYTLFDGFQRKFQLLNAKYNQQTAENADADARRLLLQAVASAFYSSKRAQDQMNIAREDAAFNQMQLDDAKKRHEVGMLKPSEVLNFVLQVQNADVNYVTAEKNWKVANVALGALLAIDIDNFWENYELVCPEDSNISHRSVIELVEYAKQHRPDMRSLEAKIEIMKEGFKAAKESWFPRVNAFADYELTRRHSAHFNDNFDRNATFGLSASWNVFNGFKTTSQIAQAEAELLSSIKEREDLEISIESEIRQNILNMEASARLLELQDGVLENARRIRDLVKEEYNEGTATITRLNEVQADMNNAASARSAAFVQLLNSIESLKTTTGENLEEATEM